MPGTLTTAVIPCAGFGTRMLPVTRAVPKVMLPIVTVPLIHRAVQEAVAAGFQKIVLIVSPGTGFIAEYFADQPRLEAALLASGKEDVLESQIAITRLAEIVAIEQTEARGNGHAVLMARPEVGDEPFGMIWPDEAFWGDESAISQVLAIWRDRTGNVLGVVEVPDSAIPALGILAGEPVSGNTWRATGVVEKPPLADAPSNLALVGPFIFTAAIFDALEQARPGAGGEIWLTDALSERIGKEPAHACVLQGVRIDTGNPAGMVAATIFEARRDRELFGRVQSILDEAEGPQGGGGTSH